MTTPITQIQARLGSSRLPGKVLYPLGPHRVIGWVVERCRSAESTDDPVLSVGDRPENDAIVEWADRADAAAVWGPEDDLLKRHLETARAVGSDPVVRITADCPFVPPQEIDRVVEAHERNDARYTTNATEAMPVGTAVDVIDLDLLEDLDDQGETHPVKRLRNNPGDWDVEFTEDADWRRYADAHIAVDTPVDYWRLVDAVEAVGFDPVAVARWLHDDKV